MHLSNDVEKHWSEINSKAYVFLLILNFVYLLVGRSVGCLVLLFLRHTISTATLRPFFKRLHTIFDVSARSIWTHSRYHITFCHCNESDDSNIYLMPAYVQWRLFCRLTYAHTLRLRSKYYFWPTLDLIYFLRELHAERMCVWLKEEEKWERNTHTQWKNGRNSGIQMQRRNVSSISVFGQPINCCRWQNSFNSHTD